MKAKKWNVIIQRVGTAVLGVAALAFVVMSMVPRYQPILADSVEIASGDVYPIAFGVNADGLLKSSVTTAGGATFDFFVYREADYQVIQAASATPSGEALDAAKAVKPVYATLKTTAVGPLEVDLPRGRYVITLLNNAAYNETPISTTFDFQYKPQ